MVIKLLFLRLLTIHQSNEMLGDLHGGVFPSREVLFFILQCMDGCNKIGWLSRSVQEFPVRPSQYFLTFYTLYSVEFDVCHAML